MPKRNNYIDEIILPPKSSGGVSGTDFFTRIIASKAILSKLSISLAAISFYVGAKNAEYVNRIEDFVFNHNIQIEEHYFGDPRSLGIDIQTNERGYREVYLLHPKSNKRYDILEDMFPKTEDMLEGIERRLEDLPRDEKQEVIKQMRTIYQKNRW